MCVSQWCDTHRMTIISGVEQSNFVITLFYTHLCKCMSCLTLTITQQFQQSTLTITNFVFFLFFFFFLLFISFLQHVFLFLLFFFLLLLLFFMTFSSCCFTGCYLFTVLSPTPFSICLLLGLTTLHCLFHDSLRLLCNGRLARLERRSCALLDNILHMLHFNTHLHRILLYKR